MLSMKLSQPETCECGGYMSGLRGENEDGCEEKNREEYREFM
jgi:hypothetical protein